MKRGVLYTLSAAVLAAYATVSSAFYRPAYADQAATSGLESEVQNIRHGIWKGKYRVDADIILRNTGKDITDKLTWAYSLCADVTYPDGQTRQSCMDGKIEDLDGLHHGETQRRSATLRPRFGLMGDPSRMKPMITIRLQGHSDKELYVKHHYLGSIGEYKCQGPCPTN